MFNPDDIKQVLGNDENSQKKLQELLNVLQKTKEKINTVSPEAIADNEEIANEVGAGAAAAAPTQVINKDDLEEAPSSLQQNPDLRRKLLKQKLYAMKAKRLTNNAKTNIQEKIKKKILDTD